MRHAVCLCCLLFLAGCVSPLQQLKERNPSGDDFASALASEYLAYAESESEQGRKLNAEYFAAKGIDALEGTNVEPEKAAPSQQDIINARGRLTALMRDDVKRAAPQKLARAQLLFDCWQHQLSKNLNQERAPCGEEFTSELSEMQQLADELSYDKQEMHEFTFAPGSSKLAQPDRVAIAKIARRLAKQTRYAVEIAVHGAGPMGQKLSENRLASVHKALMAAGIGEKHIEVTKENGARKVALHCDECDEDDHKVMITVKTHSKR